MLSYILNISFAGIDGELWIGSDPVLDLSSSYGFQPDCASSQEEKQEQQHSIQHRRHGRQQIQPTKQQNTPTKVSKATTGNATPKLIITATSFLMLKLSPLYRVNLLLLTSISLTNSSDLTIPFVLPIVFVRISTSNTSGCLGLVLRYVKTQQNL